MCFGWWSNKSYGPYTWNFWFPIYAERTLKEIFLSKMRGYGIRSATLTILHFRRENLKTKEAVKQRHLTATKNQLEHEMLWKHYGQSVFVELLLSEDLELFYTNLQNPERQPKSDQKFVHACLFLTQKLTEEEQTLLENKNRDFLNAFYSYGSDGVPHGHRYDFSIDMKAIEKSSDPESIFSCSCGHRHTIDLHVTLKSMQEEMRKRVANEDLSDMDLKYPKLKTC